MPDVPRTRTELLAWFISQAPSLAPAYEGAVRLLGDAAFPGRIHFIAHAMRDIADRLVFVLEPSRKNDSRVQYETHLDAIAKRWPKLTFSQGSVVRIDQEPIVSIGESVAQRVDQLVKDHEGRRSRSSNQRRLFELASERNPGHASDNEAGVRAFEELRQWFMHRAHLPHKVTNYDEVELAQKFLEYETIVHSLFGNFFSETEELDDVLRQTNA